MQRRGELLFICIVWAQVDALIAAEGHDLGEAEYALLLRAFAHDGSPQRGVAVLQRMSRELMQLPRSCLAAATAFFT